MAENTKNEMKSQLEEELSYLSRFEGQGGRTGGMGKVEDEREEREKRERIIDGTKGQRGLVRLAMEGNTLYQEIRKHLISRAKERKDWCVTMWGNLVVEGRR